MRDKTPEHFRRASSDAWQLIANWKRDKALVDSFVTTWLSDDAQLGFVALKHELLRRKWQYRDFFLGNPLTGYAIRKRPNYGRPFLIRLLASDQFLTREKVLLLLEFDRLQYATYWIPKDVWLPLLNKLLLDPKVCMETGEVTAGPMTVKVNPTTGKIETKTNIRRERHRLRRYELAYRLVPATLDLPDVDFADLSPQEAKPFLDAAVKKVEKRIKQYKARAEVWKRLLNYHQNELTPEKVAELLQTWQDTVPRTPSIYLDDLEQILFFLLREVQLLQDTPDAPKRRAVVDLLCDQVIERFAKVDITVKQPLPMQKTSLGECKLWLKDPLSAIGKKVHSPRIQYELNGFWRWIKALDPAKVQPID